MKYVLFLLLLLPLRCLSQHAVISAKKLNILYIGIDNPISFAVENTDCSKLTLAVEKGTSEKISECEYNVQVSWPGTTLIFIIKDRDTIAKSLYRVKFIPDPTTNWNNSWILKDTLSAQTGLSAVMVNFNLDTIFRIASFEVTVKRVKKIDTIRDIYCRRCLQEVRDEQYETLFFDKNIGGDFSSGFRQFIRDKLHAGDLIYIEEIKAIGPDGRIRKLNPIAFSIE